MADPDSRATDPGFKLWQIADIRWLHCPRCDGPARLAGRLLTCTRCAYVEGGPKKGRRRLKAVMTAKNSPKCENKSCGGPIPNYGPPVRGGGSDALSARIVCPACGHAGDYPAVPIEPLDVRKAHAALRLFRSWPSGAPYLSRRIGAHMLVVYNQQHLDALENWLGAEHRQRGSVAGLTMMARLPRWMKAARARQDVLKALAQLRGQAESEGLW
jgi:hypothetical protein